MLRRQTSSSLVLAELQKSNDDLRKKLSDSLLHDSSLESSSLIISKLCEKETEELRLTVSRLERLLALEREERSANEEKAIELLSDVKRQWQEREETRISRMRGEVESALGEAHEASRQNAKLLIELERSTSDLEDALDIKNKLKDKCQDLKAKLENLKKSFKEKNRHFNEGEESQRKLQGALEDREEAARKASSLREEEHRSSQEALLSDLQAKDKDVSRLKAEIQSLEIQVEEHKAKLREQSSRLHAALSDLKEANLKMKEMGGSHQKVDSLSKQIQDLWHQNREMSAKHEEDLQAMEESRREGEKRERERFQELQGEMERLSAEKREASSSLEESERRFKSLESDFKRLQRQNDDLSEEYARRKSDFESRVTDIREDSEAALRKKERLLQEMRDELSSISEEKDALDKEVRSLKKELVEAQGSHSRETLSLKAELSKQKEELDARGPPSPVKVINNIVVDHSSELESEKRALLFDKQQLEAYKSQLAHAQEEMEQGKKKMKEEASALTARSEKEAARLKDLRRKLQAEEDRLSSWSEELKGERERLQKEESRLHELRKEMEASRVDFDSKKAELERDFKAKLNKADESFSKERAGLSQQIQGLTREKEGMEKDLKSMEGDKSSKKELGLLKVDLRIANKQVGEHKETISYLRQAYRDERETVRKLQEESMDLKAKEEKLSSEIESLKRSLGTAQENCESLGQLKEELSQKTSEAKNLGFKLKNAEFEYDRASSRLEKAEKDVIKYRESQTQLNIYKAACLELENQAKEFETVIMKLEEKNEKLTASLSESRASSQNHESNSKTLKIEINDLKSKVIFSESQLRESNAKIGEVESLYKAEESKLRQRLKELSSSKDDALNTITELKLRMEDLLSKISALSGEEDSVKLSLKDLKESYSELLTRYQALREEQNTLTSSNEDLRVRLARTEDDLQESRDEMSKVTSGHGTVQHEQATKITQLEKLIDYLQSKLNSKRGKCRSVFPHRKCSDKENVNVALPYEALRDKLREQENKNASLLKELNSVRGELRSSRSKDNAILLPTPSDQRANHSIPHRWSSQTNMKVTKCSTCFGFVHFCRQASVCQYCHRTVHSHCAPKTLDDCGLPKTLAPVLKHSGKKPFEGYLKIPEQGGKYWMSVHVRIQDDRLLIKGEGIDSKEIELCPANGAFVYIQSSVVYTELLHTSAYDQPHVFKIGYSNNSKDTHYFMAKSFSDKATWIKEIENISLRMKVEAKDSKVEARDEPSRTELASLDPSHNVYCVAPMKDCLLLGTSSGFLFVHEGVVSPVERSPATVYQMEIVPSINKIVLITGQNRKLGVLNMDRIHSRDFNPVNLRSVKSCHLFGLGLVDKGCVYLCAVDDCRVSIFKYDEAETFRMVHKFSTDSPTSCLQFTSSSVLVITDKIYDIDLEDFAVEEFLDLDESPMTLSNNYPIAMFQINSNEFLLCFQERGLFVNSSGNKSRPDIKWNSISGQFAYSRNKLWVTYYNAVEVFDLGAREQTSKMMLSKNPQILCGQGHVYLLEERNKDLALLQLTNES